MDRSRRLQSINAGMRKTQRTAQNQVASDWRAGFDAESEWSTIFIQRPRCCWVVSMPLFLTVCHVSDGCPVSESFLWGSWLQEGSSCPCWELSRGSGGVGEGSLWRRGCSVLSVGPSCLGSPLSTGSQRALPKHMRPVTQKDVPLRGSAAGNQDQQ